MAAISTGHEVQICHRCGWPFPNPHPSARHRRAHKKICGTIEGYKIIHSEDHDHHFTISDDEEEEEQEHTPDPKLLKKAVGELGSSGSGIGGRSNRSEDDVFSDAVTEFSDSGISPLLEQKSLGADFVRSPSLYFDTTGDTPEQVNDSTRGARGASDVGIITGLQLDPVESGIVRGDVAVDNISEYGNGKSLEVNMNDKSTAITLESEEGRIPDPALSADASKEELCDKLVSDVVKLDQTETLQNMDAPAEISDSIEIVGDIAPFVETHEGDTSVGADEVFHSNENIVSIGTDAVNTSPEESLSSKPDGSIQTSSIFATEQSEAKPVVSSSIDKKVGGEISVTGGDTIAGNSDASGGGMHGNENWHQEESVNFCVDTVADGFFESGDGDDRVFEKNVVNHSEENSSCKIMGTTNEKGEGAYVEVQSTVEPTNSTDSPSSADLHGSVQTESRDNGFEKPLEGLTTDNFTEVPQPVVVYADLNRDIIGDVSDIKCSSPNNIHVTTGNVGVEPVGVVGIMTESKDDNSDEAVEVESQEAPPEQQKSELVSKDDSTDIISENSAGASEKSIDAVQVKAKPNIHNGDEEDNPSEQESSTMMKKHVNGTSADVGAELTPLSDAVVDVGNVTCAADSVTILHDDATSSVVNSNTLQTKSDDGVSSHKVGVAVVDLSAKNSSSMSDSLEGKCGSVSDAVGTDSQNPKATYAEEPAFEPPSFMKLVQSGGEDNNQVDGAVSEIHETKADGVEAGWFPSLTKVVNESEGRMKNEEMIAKVTKWSPVKQQQGSLKNLLNQVKSPKEKHNESKDDGNEEKDTKAKEMEQWNSPARYPIEIKKQKKKKGRSYWVPFVCCSSVHRDL